MGGGGQQQTSQVITNSNSPKVQETIDQLLGGVQTAYKEGPKPYTESLFPGVSGTTTGAWAMGKQAANNPAFSEGVGGAIDNYSKVARGDFLNNADPEFQALVDRSANETAADINASMGANGRYGSNVHVGALGDAIGELRTKANVDNRRFELSRQSEASQLLPQLMGAAQLPAQITGAIGASEDAAATAQRQGDYDLHTRKNNALADLIARLTSSVSGNAGAAGSTSTTYQPEVPWWQSGASLLGAFV
jgi:hypothetical protein